MRPARLGFLVAASLALNAFAAELPPATQIAVRAAVFEVVFRKSEADSLTYEKPLPLELIPYKQRTDKFHSFGTAFAIGPNRFVTASHVLMVGVGSQFGEPLLRDSAGRTYEVAQIEALSADQDFAVISLRSPPPIKPLPTNPKPSLNETVYAVGNALGEGIVIRDGLFTSETPEAQEGRWNWLRFSAAASPGNSGGPLLDSKGRVIGVVLRKSSNENLNYAAPIAAVMGARAEASVNSRTTFRLPLLDKARTISLKHTVPLPRSFADFVATWRPSIIEQIGTSRQALLTEHAAVVFPNGDGSLQELHTISTAAFPQLLVRATDGRWSSNRADDTQTADLGGNGFVRYGDMYSATWVQLRRPDEVSLEKLYGDSKLYMDYLLKAIAVKREVGSDSVRVISAGPGKELEPYIDAYGRKWRVHRWISEYDDMYYFTYSLPVPSGYVAILRRASTSAFEIAMQESRTLADFVYVSYIGTFDQWREFAAHKEWHPAQLAAIDLQIDYGRAVSYRSSRLAWSINAADFAFTPQGYLTLNFSYFRDGNRVVWDVAQLSATTDSTGDTTVSISRQADPPASLGDEFTNDWAKIRLAKHPYNGSPYQDDDTTYISKSVPLASRIPADPQQPEVRYLMTFSQTGSKSDKTVSAAFGRLLRGVQVLEK